MDKAACMGLSWRSCQTPLVPSAIMDDTDRAVLELETRWFRRAGAKDAAIRELGMASTPYYQRLHRLIDDPAAVLEFPQVTARLRRLRDERLARRLPTRRSA